MAGAFAAIAALHLLATILSCRLLSSRDLKPLQRAGRRRS